MSTARERQIDAFLHAERARERGVEIHAELERLASRAHGRIEALVSGKAFDELGRAAGTTADAIEKLNGAMTYKGIPIINGGEMIPDDEVFLVNKDAIDPPNWKFDFLR